MGLFQQYVLKIFLKYIFIVGLFVTLMSLISSTMGESKDLSQYNYSMIDFIVLQVHAIALNINVTMPAITTIATVIVIITLMRSNEILAYVSLGGTILKLAIPFIVVGIFISSIMMFWEYQVIPKVRFAREELRANMQGQVYNRSAIYANIWMMDGNNKLTHITFIDMIGGTVNGVTVYVINEKYEISKIEKIAHAKRQGDLWLINNRTVTDITVNPPRVTHFNNEELISNKLWNDLMEVAIVEVRALSPTQLNTISNIMENHGMNTNQYDMLYYSKYANAVSVIVLLILTFPIAINFSRNYSVVKNATVTLVLGLIFWVCQASSQSIGNTGILSPFLANFLPIFVFIGISAFIIYIREYRR